MIENIKLMHGKYWHPVTLERKDGRIWFLESPFALKDEIKAMQGSRWHGYDDEPIQSWSVKDCYRNNFQLSYLQGHNPYANWDRPIVEHEYTRPLRSHQRLMSDHGLTHHYKILAAEPGTGKTLSAIEIMERGGGKWWWVAPKSGVAAATEEFRKWDLKTWPEMMTYEKMTSTITNWPGGAAPLGVVFDECSRLKTFRSQRTQCAQALADAVRDEHGFNGYVIMMSGTPAPTSPLDWWAQCEICYPGFMKEGSEKAFKWRLGIFKKEKKPQGYYWDLVTWKDDERKCNTCGATEEEHPHDECNTFTPSTNEVAYLHERMAGLVLPLFAKDCLELPPLHQRVIKCKVSSTMKRVAGIIADNAPTAIQALTDCRALSDGFQYKEEQTGMKTCPECKGEGTVNDRENGAQVDCPTCDGKSEVPKIERVTKKMKCPKDDVLIDLLDENVDIGRLVVFAGFTASIDRCRELCLAQGWDVCQVDGRGWKVFTQDGPKSTVEALTHWRSNADLVVFLANPLSGGMALTLTEAKMAVFYSNDFNRESRQQAIKRIHRLGMGETATIVDIDHLPTDQKVREYLNASRRLELMSLGEVTASLESDE